jgi:hypothetical protein
MKNLRDNYLHRRETNHQFDKIPRVGDACKLIKGGEAFVDFLPDSWIDNYCSWAV